MRRFGFIFFAALLSAFSCVKPDSEPNPAVDQVPAGMTLSASSLDAPASGATLSLTVTSPARPKVSGLPDWIEFKDGTFNHYSITFRFVVAKNSVEEPREAVITVSAKGLADQNLTVRQAAAEPEPEPTPPDPGADSDGWENAAAAVLNMRTGWNLGNTLDTCGDWLDGQSVSRFETGWGQAITTPALMQLFADAGFGAIRVPVTWYQHMDANGQVDKAWMDRVEEVVGYVLDAGMYCILNVHHDTGTNGWLRADQTVYNNTRLRFITLWQQIAERFKDYGSKLLFESFNEMLDASNYWNEPKSSTSYIYIDKYNQDFVNAVRGTGSNNAKRNLVINDYCASSVANAFAALTIPQDSAKDHIIAEFHSYSPYMFAMYEGAGEVTTWSEAAQKEVQNQIKSIATLASAKGVPFIIGEYGTTAPRADTEIAKQVTCYVQTCKQYGGACFCWMLLSDGADRSVPKWTKPYIKDAIIRASL